MKISSDTIGNRTRDLPTCSAVPQPTALPRTALSKLYATECTLTYNKELYFSEFAKRITQVKGNQAHDWNKI